MSASPVELHFVWHAIWFVLGCMCGGSLVALVVLFTLVPPIHRAGQPASTPRSK